MKNKKMNSRQMRRKLGTDFNELMGMLETLNTMVEGNVLKEIEKSNLEEVKIKKKDALKMIRNGMKEIKNEVMTSNIKNTKNIENEIKNKVKTDKSPKITIKSAKKS